MSCLTHRMFGGLLMALALIAATPSAHANSPQFRSTTPAGAQRGTTIEVMLHGDRLDDPQELMLYDNGLKIEKLEAVDKKKVKATIAIAPDCRLGEHRFRLRTTRGLTELRTFYVGALPQIEEKEPNNDLTAPQKIDMGVTIEGVIQNEDVDIFSVDLKKGQRISIEAEGIRLGRTMFDPHLSILDAKRFELTASDDTALLRQDAFTTLVAPEDGTYAILIRDSAYGGNGASNYRLHVGSFPRPTVTFPAGGKPGESLQVKFLGDGEAIVRDFPLPDQTNAQFPVFAQTDAGIAPSANWLRLNHAANTFEIEPNDARDKATASEHALPVAFNGIIQQADDEDWLAVTLKKGQRVECRAWARDLRSPLDPVLNVYAPDGKHIKGGDDLRDHPDPYVDFTAPADGVYTMRVRDHLERGGADFVYRLEVTERTTDLQLSIPHVSRYDSQSRQWAAIPRGNRFMIMLNATRSNFGGDLKLLASALPDGVTMHAKPMSSDTNQMAVVFEAKPDAPISGLLMDLTARPVDEKIDVVGRFVTVAELVQGNPNRTPYYATTVDRFPIAVTEAAPFQVNIVTPKVPLLQAGQMNLKIVVERQEGFDEEIRIKFPFRPPGLNAQSEIKIPKGKNEATYPLNTNGNAKPGKWPIAVEARAKVEDGELYVSSQLTELEIAPALVQGKIQMAVTEQGKPIKVICALDQKEPFEGEATLELFGLPNKVVTKPIKITKDTKEVTFDVTTDPASPVGMHKSLFCRITLERHGEPMHQSLAGGGALRIDKPRPAPVAKKTDAAKPAPTQAAPKQLTRLEQLRQERLANQAAESKN